MKPLVLCIDRDNDIGTKIKVHGPIVGWKKNVEVAQSLALVDPEDSDVNAIFGAVKLARTINAEVATITGDSHVGVISDEKLTRQLEKLLHDLKPSSVILVTDGAEDDQIIPLIQSRIKITSIKTIVVRQSKELEKAYFTMTNFLREVSEDPNLARLLFAVPGIVLVLLAIGGSAAFNLILGIVGVYLIIKGLGYEEEFFDRTSEFIKSISLGKISALTYLLAVIVFIIGLGFGYSDLTENPLDFTDFRSTLDSLSLFLLNTKAINLLVLTVTIILIGKLIDDLASKEYLQVRRHMVLFAFIVLFNWMLTSGARFWSEEHGLGDFMLSAILGIFGFLLWVKVTNLLFLSEVQLMENTIKNYSEKEVFTMSGDRLGKVSGVLFKGGELSAVKVGRQIIRREDIVSAEKVLVVKD